MTDSLQNNIQNRALVSVSWNYARASGTKITLSVVVPNTTKSSIYCDSNKTLDNLEKKVFSLETSSTTDDMYAVPILLNSHPPPLPAEDIIWKN